MHSLASLQNEWGCQGQHAQNLGQLHGRSRLTAAAHRRRVVATIGKQCNPGPCTTRCTLWSSNRAMENNHFQWVSNLQMLLFFRCHVSLPYGNPSTGHLKMPITRGIFLLMRLRYSSAPATGICFHYLLPDRQIQTKYICKVGPSTYKSGLISHLL